MTHFLSPYSGGCVVQSIPFEPHKSASFADSALKKSVGAMEQAQQCAVLWFGEIMRRRLYRKLGYSTINQYAHVELKFCKTRTGDFVQLARKLEHLPAVRESVESGELGYTKAREIIKVATPKTEEGWLTAAKDNSRRELERKVAVARKRAKSDPNQAELMPIPSELNIPPAAPPVRLTVEMTSEQFAIYEALLEKLHKQGPLGNRAEMLLEAMAELVEAHAQKAPRGAFQSSPPFQIHIHQCPDCSKATISTSKGELPVSKEVMERAQCDSQVDEEGKRNTSTIPPATRRKVLSRDRHCCRAPGCEHTKFLEVHHVIPRADGGGIDPENLITLCSACHRLMHEKTEALIAAV
jgi:5-methylcytosine-specific restriction endonuclease McrA